jgi:hypothetical protein
VIVGDALVEGDETIVLDMTANANVYFTIPTQTITITENVGTADLVEQSMNVYPNPANSYVNIQSPYSISSVQCIDMSGRVIESKKMSSHTTQVNWSLESIAAGSYFFIIETPAGISRVPVNVIK